MSKSNLAYDLSVYAPEAHAPQPEQKPQPQPQLKVVKKQYRAFAGAFAPRVLCAFAIVMTLISLIVYNQVYLNELSREVNELDRQLAILENESIRYASLLESTVSLRAIAQQAEYMGMVRLDQYRTIYVYLYEEDQITLFTPEPGYEQGGALAVLGDFISGARNILQ